VCEECVQSAKSVKKLGSASVCVCVCVCGWWVKSARASVWTVQECEQCTVYGARVRIVEQCR
jgi:hypothetical protein